MRVLMVILALVFACAAVAFADSAASSTMPGMSENNTTMNSMDTSVDTGTTSSSSMTTGSVVTGTTMMTTSADADAFNRTFISQYYGIPRSDVDTLVSRGFSWGEMNLIANTAARTNTPALQIADMRTQGMTWAQIASRCNTTLAALQTPASMRRVTAMGPVYGAGPTTMVTMPRYMYDRGGNVLLNEDMAQRFVRSGYDWTDVAVAANISRETGYPIDQVLQQLRTGATWPDVATHFGVAPSTAFNVADYPFERKSNSYTDSTLRTIERYQRPSGAYVYPSGMQPDVTSTTTTTTTTTTTPAGPGAGTTTTTPPSPTY